MAVKAPALKLRFCGCRPLSIPFWTSFSFLVGAVLFTLGSLAWMLPYVGDTAHGASEWAALTSMTYPFFVGGIGFLAG